MTLLLWRVRRTVRDWVWSWFRGWNNVVNPLIVNISVVQCSCNQFASQAECELSVNLALWTVRVSLLLRFRRILRWKFNAFSWTAIKEIRIPGSVRVMVRNAFTSAKGWLVFTLVKCLSLLVLMLEHSWKLRLQKCFIPSSVREIRERCFFRCLELNRVVFREDSLLGYIGEYAFSDTNIGAVCVPDSVRELREGCFSECD